MVFDYEELKDGSMTYLGSSILKGMSSEIPTLDMFIREAIQNSLDARLDNEKFVKEEINCGEFNIDDLIEYYPQISSGIKDIKSDNNQYISIRDYNTTGLEGFTSYSEYKKSKSGDIGKFLSLVRNVGKSNKINDAGGSWGYGKTTYFRLGVGLVIYYTRIFDEKTGEYEERLMTGMIENEKNSSGLLYDYQDNNHTGVAWWGKFDGDELLPVKDHDVIVKFLELFNIIPYKENETGTCIIIPFIDEKKLLGETIPTTINESNQDIPFWCRSIEEYLDISCQRWYPTKYCNFEIDSPSIMLYINGNLKYSNSMYPVFSVYQKMYNMYLNGIEENDNIESFEIKINRLFNDGATAGTLYYSYLSKEDLRMDEYGNNPSPFAQIKNSSDENDSRTIIGFCRTPGMILKYDTNGAWTNGIVNIEPEKYLICLFVPNSNNTTSVTYTNASGETTQLKISIEDYLRASERAEHSDWTDSIEYTFPDGKKVDTSKLRIVGRIQKNIRNEFNRKSKLIEENATINIGTALNQKLASMFMPRSGFGRKPSIKTNSPGGDTPKRRTVTKTKFVFGNIEIDNNSSFAKDFTIQLKPGDNKIEMEYKVLSDGDPIPATSWIGEKFPVDTISIEVDSITTKKDKISLEHYYVFKETFNKISFDWLTLENNYNYGFEMQVDDDIIEISGKIHYMVLDPSVSLIISMRSSGDNE